MGNWPQSFGTCSPATLHCWLMTPTQPRWPDPSVERGHPPSCCKHGVCTLRPCGVDWRDLSAPGRWPAWPSLLHGTLCPSLSLARRRHSLWAASVVLRVKHCSCCPFPGFCDSVGPSHNCEAGVLHQKMGSCLVGWTGTFVLIAVSRMPVPPESSDLAGITQQADTT